MKIPLGYQNVRFFAQFAGHQAETALGMQVGLPPEEAAPLMYDAWVEYGIALGWPDSVLFSGLQIQVGTGVNTPPLPFDHTGAETGSGSGALVPPNTSFLYTKRTTTPGRTGRGRMFVPFVRESLVQSDGNLEAGVVTTLDDEMAGLLGAINIATEDGDLVIFHKLSSDPSEITSLQANTKVATQRRRLRS